MRFNLVNSAFAVAMFASFAVLATGCGQQSGDGSLKDGSIQVSDASHEGHEGEEDGHDHGGWWCNEHGIPEEDCAMCDSKLAAELREKGDWCEEHNRPDSLCFKCHPENAEKFAKLYEAKVGHAPPKPTE